MTMWISFFSIKGRIEFQIAAKIYRVQHQMSQWLTICVQVRISGSPLTCVFILLLPCVCSLLHAASGSFRQPRDENAQTEQEERIEGEREWKTAYIQKKKNDAERWYRCSWRNKRATCHFPSLHVFSPLFLLFFLCNGVAVECFYVCTLRTQQNRAWPTVRWGSRPLHPSVRPSHLPSSSPPLYPLPSDLSLQAPETLQDQIIPILTVPLHRMTWLTNMSVGGGVNRAVDQYQWLNDLSASCWKLWPSQSTLWSVFRTEISTHELDQTTDPPAGLTE